MGKEIGGIRQLSQEKWSQSTVVKARKIHGFIIYEGRLVKLKCIVLRSKIIRYRLKSPVGKLQVRLRPHRHKKEGTRRSFLVRAPHNHQPE